MPDQRPKFSLRARFSSFRYALSGIRQLLLLEHNSRIHLVAALVVITAGIYFQVNRYEWIALIFAISLVLLTEIFNTAIEKLCDLVSLERNPKIKHIKDLAAAAVLLAALTAVAIGIFVFAPYI